MKRKTPEEYTDWHEWKRQTDPEFVERSRQRSRDWYARNKKHCKEVNYDWRADNIQKYRDYQKEYHKKWRQENKEKWNEICRASYHRRKQQQEGTSE